MKRQIKVIKKAETTNRKPAENTNVILQSETRQGARQIVSAWVASYQENKRALRANALQFWAN